MSHLSTINLPSMNYRRIADLEEKYEKLETEYERTTKASFHNHRLWEDTLDFNNNRITENEDLIDVNIDRIDEIEGKLNVSNEKLAKAEDMIAELKKEIGKLSDKVINLTQMMILQQGKITKLEETIAGKRKMEPDGNGPPPKKQKTK